VKESFAQPIANTMILTGFLQELMREYGLCVALLEEHLPSIVTMKSSLNQRFQPSKYA
jgi:hypothetical protein